MAERQQQIEAQLLNIREQQKESVEKREQLLEMIEQEAQVMLWWRALIFIYGNLYDNYIC